MTIPKWLEFFIIENAFTLSPEQLKWLNVNSREEFLWKYIVMNILKPTPPQYSYFITSDDEDFLTSENDYLQVKTY